MRRQFGSCHSVISPIATAGSGKKVEASVHHGVKLVRLNTYSTFLVNVGGEVISRTMTRIPPLCGHRLSKSATPHSGTV